MIIYIIFLCINVVINPVSNSVYNTNATYISFCPSETERTQQIIADFFTLESSLPIRIEHGLENLNQNDITLLTGDDYEATCVSLFGNHQQAITEVYQSNGDMKRETAFYKAGDFFFVIFAHQQPEDPQQVAIGPSAIIIYDEDSMDVIGAYSF